MRSNIRSGAVVPSLDADDEDLAPVSEQSYSLQAVLAADQFHDDVVRRVRGFLVGGDDVHPAVGEECLHPAVELGASYAGHGMRPADRGDLHHGRAHPACRAVDQ
ncbi:hypothetical protein ACQ4WX_04210 [Streptomyces lasalocidi]